MLNENIIKNQILDNIQKYNVYYVGVDKEEIIETYKSIEEYNDCNIKEMLEEMRYSFIRGIYDDVKLCEEEVYKMFNDKRVVYEYDIETCKNQKSNDFEMEM